MSIPTIRMDEWKKALEAATRREYPDGFTSAEAGVALGISQSRASAKMRDLVRAGVVQYVGRKPVAAMDGRSILVPCYQWAKKRRVGR